MLCNRIRTDNTTHASHRHIATDYVEKPAYYTRYFVILDHRQQYVAILFHLSNVRQWNRYNRLQFWKMRMFAKDGKPSHFSMRVSYAFYFTHFANSTPHLRCLYPTSQPFTHKTFYCLVENRMSLNLPIFHRNKIKQNALDKILIF